MDGGTEEREGGCILDTIHKNHNAQICGLGSPGLTAIKECIGKRIMQT